MSDPANPKHAADRSGWWTRDRALTAVLVAATAILLFLCWLLVQPFLAPLAWAIALAVVAHPLHGWIERRIHAPNVAAAIAILVIVVGIVGPTIFVGQNILRETTKGVNALQSSLESGKWREQLKRSPRIGRALEAIEGEAHLGGQLQSAAAELGKRISSVVVSSAWAIVNLLITLFVLFYLFRDRRQATATIRSLVPLSSRETDEVFARVTNTIYATIYGTLVVSAVQGALGGLMFWWLGLPAPVLWGMVMGLLAIIPVLGAFVIWLPAAIWLAATGDWTKAIILTVWGSIVIGLIDNLLYPILVGKRLRLHTVPVFFSILGGLAVFGVAGLILGPVILALTDAILEIWRRRTSSERSVATG
jgi:predicted PurR-regulated permease PerM